MRLVYEECTRIRMNSDLNLSLGPPNNGLSIRSAFGSVPEKKASMYWEAELSETVHSPTYNIATEKEFIILRTVSPVGKDLAIDPALFTSLKGDAMNVQMCKLDIGRDSGFSEKMVEMNSSLAKDNAQDKTVSPNSMRDEGNGNTSTVVKATRSNSPGLKDGRTGNAIHVSDEQHLNTRLIEFMFGGLTDMKIRGSLYMNKDNGKSKVPNALVWNPSFWCKELVGSNTELMEGRPNKMIGAVSACALHLEKLETTNGKKLQSPSDSDIGIRNRLRGGEELFQLEVCPVSKASPVRSFTSKRKGKEVIVFNGDMKEEAREDSDSYESVESCNTSRLVGARKRRAVQFIGGRKRVKLQIQETPDFTSFTTSDGSFVNWISTLAKGLFRPTENRAPSLGDVGNGTEKKGPIMCSRVQDHKCGKMGFQSLFWVLTSAKS